MKTGIELISEERARQIEAEGRSKELDTQYHEAELAKAASCYLDHAIRKRNLDTRFPGPTKEYCQSEVPYSWPWGSEHWKPKNQVRDLVRAGALIAAEIDRLLSVPEDK